MSELKCIETGCLLNEPVELDGVGRTQEVLLVRAGTYEIGDSEGGVLQRLDE